MGVLTIDTGIGGRLDDYLAKIAFEFYYRGMTLASEIKQSPASLAKENTSQIDPPFGTKSMP